MKVGSLVKTICFGPKGSVGEVGIIIKPSPRMIKCWEVLFGDAVKVLAEHGLEVINESR